MWIYEFTHLFPAFFDSLVCHLPAAGALPLCDFSLLHCAKLVSAKRMQSESTKTHSVQLPNYPRIIFTNSPTSCACVCFSVDHAEQHRNLFLCNHNNIRRSNVIVFTGCFKKIFFFLLAAAFTEKTLAKGKCCASFVQFPVSSGLFQIKPAPIWRFSCDLHQFSHGCLT